MSAQHNNKARTSFAYLRLAVGIVSIALLLVAAADPKREIPLFPESSTRAVLFSDGDTAMGGQGQSKVTSLNSQNTTFLCEIKEGSQYKSCGMSLMWPKVLPEGGLDPVYVDYEALQPQYFDFTDIEHLRVRFSYRGSAEQLRFYFRNANDGYSYAQRDGNPLLMANIKLVFRCQGA